MEKDLWSHIMVSFVLNQFCSLALFCTMASKEKTWDPPSPTFYGMNLFLKKEKRETSIFSWILQGPFPWS